MWRVDRWLKGEPGRWVPVRTMTEPEALSALLVQRGVVTMQAICLDPAPGQWERMWTMADGSFARLRHP